MFVAGDFLKPDNINIVKTIVKQNVPDEDGQSEVLAICDFLHLYSLDKNGVKGRQGSYNAFIVSVFDFLFAYFYGVSCVA